MEKGVAYISLVACEASIEEKDNSWYLDAGASNHMCGSEHMFIDISKITIKSILIKLKSSAYQFIEECLLCFWDEDKQYEY